jgi:hypothetical protein
MIDDDFIDRTKIAQVIDWFALQSAHSRSEFMDRFEAMPLDSGGKELLSTLAKLHFELTRIQGD